VVEQRLAGALPDPEPATPSIRPLLSCSAARTDAPPPFETLEAMTTASSGVIGPAHGKGASPSAHNAFS
jgi:hypothetical protein